MPQEEIHRYGSPRVAINKQRHTWLPTAPEVQDCWKSMVDRPGSYNNPATGFRVGHSGFEEVKRHRLTITPLLGLRAYNNPGRPDNGWDQAYNNPGHPENVGWHTRPWIPIMCLQQPRMSRTRLGPGLQQPRTSRHMLGGRPRPWLPGCGQQQASKPASNCCRPACCSDN